MSASLSSLVPELQAPATDLVNAAGAAGLLPRLTSTRRTHSEQIRLYARYLAGRSAYPTAFPGTSAHEYGEAFDLLVTPYESLEDVGYTWQTWGGTWGGAADPIHFELPGASRKHQHRNIALVADLIVGMIPGISEVELGSALLSFGFPDSEVLKFLASPIETITQPKGVVPISYHELPTGLTLEGVEDPRLFAGFSTRRDLGEVETAAEYMFSARLSRIPDGYGSVYRSA